ncbi:MAG: hypothetical protein ACYTEW_25550, partial [Planctomycetota bacterium]
QVNITTECLPAGTYWLFVAPQDFDNLPCDSNSDYVATLTCQGCVIPAPDIRIEPNQLNFDCNSLGGASSSSLTMGTTAAMPTSLTSNDEDSTSISVADI